MFTIIHKDVNVTVKKKKKYTNFEVNVFGLKIPVIFTPHIYDRQGSNAAGMFMRNDSGKEVILISTEDNEYHKDIVITLVHEMAHACIFRLGLHNTSLSHDVEETIVDGIATMLTENFDFDF